MADDRIVVKEPRLDLGTNRVLRHGMSGEDAFAYLDIHHPKANAAAVRAGDPSRTDRPSDFVEGSLEAVRTRGDKDGIPLVQKDLILETPRGSRNVMIPNPVAGYAEFRNDGTNAISIWSGKPGDPNRELVGQVLHGARGTSPFKDGDFVPYGAPLVRQSDVGSPGAVHAHIELEPAQYKRYLGDILNDRITRSQWPGQSQGQAPSQPEPSERQSPPAAAMRPGVPHSHSHSAPQAPRDAMADGVLKQGENGPAVRQLQETLNRLGVRDAQGKPLETDGRFGPHTREAVEAFQRQHGLDQDGKAGPDTFKALKGAQRDAMADGVLKQGENGPAVRELQETLNRLGLRDAQGKPLDVDGRFGPHTREAVEAFQRNHGLDPDGKAGPLTLGLLKTGQPAQNALDMRGLKPEREGPPPFLPERAQGPLISNAAHPDNALFRQAYEGLGKLGPGGYLSERERENAAASLAYEARLSGVKEINHVVANKNGNGYFGVQGEPGDPASHRVYVDKAQAAVQPVEQTTQNLRQDLAALPQPAVQQDQQNKQVAHAHAH